MQVYQNISLAQINITAGVDEYYLPKNVNWAGATIEKILIVAPTASMVSPIDGEHVLTSSELSDLYFDLYDANDDEISHSLHYSNLLSTNNYPVEIGRTLSLNLSRLFFSTSPATSGALLMYVFYNKKEAKSVEESQENITIRFDLLAGEKLSFDTMIDRYMYARDKHIKRIICWEQSAPAFLTLRDVTEKLAFTELHTALFRSPLNGGTADATSVDPIMLDAVDLDFANCYIYNTTNSNQSHVITFEY